MTPERHAVPGAGRVLLIGGTGFIGRYLTQALERAGWQIGILSRHPSERASGGQPGQIEHLVGDMHVEGVLDAALGSFRPNSIVMLAATADIARVDQQPETGLRDFKAVFDVLVAARAYAVARVVYVSSTSALATRQYEPIDCGHPLVIPSGGPAGGLYGAFKAAGEVVALAYGEVHDIDVRVVRAQSVYGFGMRAPMPLKLLLEGALAGTPVHLATGGGFPRDYTHVLDVVSMLITLLGSRDLSDHVFICGTGQPTVTGQEVAALVRSAIPDCEISIEDAWTALEHRDQRYRGRVDISSARDQLGWSPDFPILGDGIAQYAEAYRHAARRQTS